MFFPSTNKLVQLEIVPTENQYSQLIVWFVCVFIHMFVYYKKNMSVYDILIYLVFNSSLMQ